MTALQKYLEGIRGKRIAVIGAGVSNTPLIALLREAGLPVGWYYKVELCKAHVP